MKKYILLSLATVFLFLPVLPVLAQTGALPPLIVCEGNGCNACHVVKLINNVIEFALILSVFIATVLFAYAGFLFVTAQGNESKIASGKHIFVDVFIGILIALIAFLVVDTMMQMLVGNNLLGGGKWNEIQCVANPTPTSPGGPWQPGSTTPAVIGGAGEGSGAGDTTFSCRPSEMQGGGSCVEVSQTALASKNCAGCSGGGCQRVIDPRFADQLGRVEGSWCASSIGMEPSGHANECHKRGSCIDMVCAKGQNCTPEQALALQTSMRNNGLVPIYELPASASDADVERYRSAGVCAYRQASASGGHFSVYPTIRMAGSQLGLGGKNCI